MKNKTNNDKQATTTAENKKKIKTEIYQFEKPENDSSNVLSGKTILVYSVT